LTDLKNYKPELMGLLVGIGSLNLWYLSSVAIDESILPQNFDYIIRILTVAVGGFIGAYSAFKLQAHQEYQVSLNARKAALNSALFVLIRQINAIQCIKRDFDEFNTPLKRALSLPAHEPPNYSDVKQDFKSLEFLIEKGEPQILLDLTIEQKRFEQTINSITIRNGFYVDEVQPVLSYHGLNGRYLAMTEFEEKLGERIFQGAMKGANVMYDHVCASGLSLAKQHKELELIARKLYPRERFIGMKKEGL